MVMNPGGFLFLGCRDAQIGVIGWGVRSFALHLQTKTSSGMLQCHRHSNVRMEGKERKEKGKEKRGHGPTGL
jgi:hypothetical protein